MLTNQLFLGILLCGTIAGMSFTKRRFEELIPISAMGLIVILFFFGLFGAPLSVGAAVVMISYIAICAAAVLRLAIRDRRELKELLLHRLLTPAFFVFLVIFFALSYFDNGKLATGWDEFTHWIDSVKAMVMVDDFVTNPMSGSMFKNYPPSMSLFQFFLQKLYCWTHLGETFNEWRVYFAYQILFVSVWMPFLKKLHFRRPLEWFLLPLLLLLLPVFLFRDFYMSLYIDAFLGILAGCGMAYIVMQREKKAVDLIYLVLLLFTLTLAKDAGRLFSLFIALTFVLETWLRRKGDIFSKKTGLKRRLRLLLLPLAMFAAAYLPHLFWQIELRISEISGASVPVRFGKFLGILWFGQTDTEYGRDSVVQSFSQEFFGKRWLMGQWPMSFAILTLLLLAFAVLVLICCQKRLEKDSARYTLIGTLLFIMLLVYVLGLGALYISRFSDYEAANLASYDRYMGIGYLAVLEFIMLLAVWLFQNLEGLTAVSFGSVLLLFSVCAGPVDQMQYYLSRESVTASQAYREAFETAAQKISALPEDARVYMVAQESNGEEKVIYHYILRPRSLEGFGSIGGPFYEGDVWSLDLSPEEWMDRLLEKDDYVIIKRVNDEFVETFGYLFEDPERIAPDAVFRIDKENRKLIFVE